MGGFSINDDFDEAWKDIETYVGSLQDILDESKLKKLFKEIGAAVAKAVKRYAPKRSQNPSYSDAGKGQYKHIIDDIGYSVKKSRSTKQWYVSIHGKKWTGYKWLWVNDGHLTTDGDWVEGCHFVDKAEAASSAEVDQIIDKFLKDALEDK